MKQRRRNPQKLTTDGKWHDFKYRDEVPKSVLKSEFDWLDAEETDHFLKYKGTWHHLAQFERTTEPGWDGHLGYSWSNGVLIKVSPNGEQYKIAYFYHTADNPGWSRKPTKRTSRKRA